MMQISLHLRTMVDMIASIGFAEELMDQFESTKRAPKDWIKIWMIQLEVAAIELSVLTK